MPRPSQRESDKATLLSWALTTLLLVKPGGTLSTTRPTPLSRRDIADVIRMIRAGSAYEDQTIIVHAKDGHPVTLRGGPGMGWRN